MRPNKTFKMLSLISLKGKPRKVKSFNIILEIRAIVEVNLIGKA